MSGRHRAGVGAPLGNRRVGRGLATALVAVSAAVLPGCDPGSTGPEPERLLGTQLLEGGELAPGASWAWLDATEIVFLGFDGAGLHAVDAATGARRTVVPAGAASLRELHVVPPYAYYLQDSTLHRVRTDGGSTPEPLIRLAEADDWSVSADHAWIYWLESTYLVRARTEPGATRDTLTMLGQTHRMRVFASTDGTAALSVDWDLFPGRLVWTRVEGPGDTGRPPCRIREGSVVRWEADEPVLYAACLDVFLRHPVTGDSTRVATIGGGQDGTFSTDLTRVSAWRRYCPRWVDASTCPEAERELWVAEAGETPGRVGTLITAARAPDGVGSFNPLDDTSPAYFSPDGARVAYVLNALSDHDGLWVVPLD